MRSYLYSLIESNEIYDFSIFWGEEKHQRQKSWFYKDLSMPLKKKIKMVRHVYALMFSHGKKTSMLHEN